MHVMCVHGATGARKSAIAQTIAQMPFEQWRPGVSFFFAQGSSTGQGLPKLWQFPELAHLHLFSPVTVFPHTT